MTKWMIATLLLATVALAQQTHKEYEPPNATGAGRRSEIALAICGRLGRREDFLPHERQTSRDQGRLQTVHDSGRPFSAVGLYILQS